jgi:hypothetical protein
MLCSGEHFRARITKKNFFPALSLSLGTTHARFIPSSGGQIPLNSSRGNISLPFFTITKALQAVSMSPLTKTLHKDFPGGKTDTFLVSRIKSCAQGKFAEFRQCRHKIAKFKQCKLEIAFATETTP